MVSLALAALQYRSPIDPPLATTHQAACHRSDRLSVYWPLARFAALAEAAGLSVASLPLSYYRRCSLYTMRTDARDRFGTPLEQRFTRSQIRDMCAAAGLVDVRFSSRAPYWCVVGFKAR